MNKDYEGVIFLTGAAAPARHVTTSRQIINNDKTEIGREFVKESLTSTVKKKLIKVNKTSKENSNVAITETEKEMAKALKAKSGSRKYVLNNKNTNRETLTNKDLLVDKRLLTNKGLLANKDLSADIDLSADKDLITNKDLSVKKSLLTDKDFSVDNRNLYGDELGFEVKEQIPINERKQDSINKGKAYGEYDTFGNHISRHTIKYLEQSIRHSKYYRNALIAARENRKQHSRYLTELLQKNGVNAGNSRYVSKLGKAILLDSKEARLLALKSYGKTNIKIAREYSKAVIRSIGKKIEEAEFYSDDLGIEAVQKTKNFIFKNYRTLTLRKIQKSIQRAKQIARYIYQTAKITVKILTNPIVLKSIAIFAVVTFMVLAIASFVSSAVSIFNTYTYSAVDNELSDTYAYITYLDSLIAEEIENVENDPRWRYIDVFHIYATAPETDPLPIISYLTVKYEDFKFNNTIKNEIKTIHSELYQLDYQEWRTSHVGYDAFGSPYTYTLNHLGVYLHTKSWEQYVEEKKDVLFPNDNDYERYESLNNIGGTTMREELGPPFPGNVVTISSRYGHRFDPISKEVQLHEAIDIEVPYGTHISAVMGGRVEQIGFNREYGNYVIITSGNKKTLYANCETILVSEDQIIKKGEIIATVGNTGSCIGTYLHLEFEKDGKKLNPAFYIPKEQFEVLN